MIFYFTGTGNSRWVAEALRKALEEPLVSIVEVLTEEKSEYVYPLGEREKVIFVFPVHSWGPAVLVTRLISRLRLEGYGGQAVYFVCTCGDDCGYTDRIMRKTLQNKLRKASERIQEVIGSIRREENLPLYYAGGVPFLKSYLVYPLFVNFAIGSNRFYATETCVSCGICAKICPTGTISLSDDRKPEWADTCVQCVACIHRCPVRAIEYGKISLKKGRYHHPEFK